MSSEKLDSNKYAYYRQVRYQRTNRPLGRMSWWRVVLGAALLLAVFFIAGTFSQQAAARGNFALAEKLMVSPGWMERYKPDTKAVIDSGSLLTNGDYDTAYDTVVSIDKGMLSEKMVTVYRDICVELKVHYCGIESTVSEGRVIQLQMMIDALTGS